MCGKAQLAAPWSVVEFSATRRAMGFSGALMSFVMERHSQGSGIRASWRELLSGGIHIWWSTGGQLKNKSLLNGVKFLPRSEKSP